MPWEALVDHVGPILDKSATAHAAFCRDHFTTKDFVARLTSSIVPNDGTSTPSVAVRNSSALPSPSTSAVP